MPRRRSPSRNIAKRKKARRSPPARGAAGAPPGQATDPLARARELATRGALRDAFDIVSGVLVAEPANWRAMHLMALILWSAGLRDKAVPLMAEAITAAPDTADARAECVPELLHMASKSNLKTDVALALAERTIARHGPSFALLEGLTTLHLARGAFPQALTVAERLVELHPDNPKAHFALSAPLLMLGRGEDAVAAYGRGLRPYDATPGKSNEEMRCHYASLAPAYDDNKLHRSFSAQMARFVLEIAGATENKRILDAGCGTGLLGTHIKAARLVGIDLSPDMLARARARNVYSELVEGDMTSAMADRADRFDIVASSCALYHLADLAPFFREAARVLVPGGYLFFSVDPAPDHLEIGSTTSSEYAHSRRYLRRLAAENGFAETAIRIMEHRYYLGFWCAFRCEG